MISYSLRKDHNIWAVTFRTQGIDGKTIQHTKSTGYKAINSKGKEANKRKADQKAKEIISRYENVDFVSGEVLFYQYIEKMLERQKHTWRNTTFRHYSDMLKNHIKPYFEKKRLKIRDVRPSDLEAFYAYKIQCGLSPNTVHKYHTLIYTALKDAVKNNVVLRNVAEFAKPPKKVKAKQTYYTSVEQVKKLWTTMQGTPMELPTFFGLFFGLRRQEALGVRWSNIDFDNKTLTINSTVTRESIDGKIIDVASNNMKTEASNRIFLLNDKSCDYLKSVKEKQDKYIRETKEFMNFVCVNEVGVRYRTDYVSRKFESEYPTV